MKTILILSLSITACGLQGAQGETGKRGPAGPRGAPAPEPTHTRRVVTVNEIVVLEATLTPFEINAACDEGEVLITGGCSWDGDPQGAAVVFGSRPTETGWQCTGISDTTSGRAVSAYALCELID